MYATPLFDSDNVKSTPMALQQHPSLRRIIPRATKNPDTPYNAGVNHYGLQGSRASTEELPTTRSPSISSRHTWFCECCYFWSSMDRGASFGSRFLTLAHGNFDYSNRSLASAAPDDLVEQEPPTSPNPQSYGRKPASLRYVPTELTVHPPPLSTEKRRASVQVGPVKPADKTIEIFPGVSARLRGSEETYRAMLSDQYVPVDCECCESPLFVIQDAGYVVCPACKVVSPAPLLVETCWGGGEEPTASQRLAGGVGLGFDFEELRNALTAFGPQRGNKAPLTRNAICSDAA